MRILFAAGARPNFVKVAPVLAAASRGGHETLLVHTGQHHGARMSGAFFRDLELPEPDFHLGAGGDGRRTARVMEAFEPVLRAARPDWVVVVGDVDSTVACALVAARLREETGARLAHVEAGLRSGDWRMPEEVNRVVTDRHSDLLLTPSHDALPHLLAEGIDPARVVFVGNVMIDTLRAKLPHARRAGLPGRMGLPRGGYAVATLHRPSNVDHPEALEAVLEALARVAGEMPVVVPLHPRTRARVEAFGMGALLARLRVLEPLGYAGMLSLVDGSAVVLTDSGGLQEETTVLGIPCVTLREQTERPVTLAGGTNRLAPWPLSPGGVHGAFLGALAAGRAEPWSRAPDGWDGHAAGRIVAALEGAGAAGEPVLAAAGGRAGA